MANINAPTGLKPIKVLGGGCPRPSGIYTIASGYAANIFHGQAVEMTGTGTNIQQAPVGNVDNIGVFDSVRYIDGGGKLQVRNNWVSGTAVLAGTKVEAFVYDDPKIIYEAQADNCAEAAVGALADLDAVTGNATTGVSTAQVEASATATTGKSMRILRLIDRPDNAYGAYAKVEVMFVEHALGTGAAGAGGV